MHWETSTTQSKLRAEQDIDKGLQAIPGKSFAGMSSYVRRDQSVKLHEATDAEDS